MNFNIIGNCILPLGPPTSAYCSRKVTVRRKNCGTFLPRTNETKKLQLEEKTAALFCQEQMKQKVTVRRKNCGTFLPRTNETKNIQVVLCTPVKKLIKSHEILARGIC
jgi:hypothetical protein